MLYKRKIIVARDWWRVREGFPVPKKCEFCCSICFADMVNIFENENLVIILKGYCCKNSNRKYYYSEKHVPV